MAVIRVEQVKTGMTLKNDVLVSGIKLLGKGKILNEDNIKSLNRFRIEQVEIFDQKKKVNVTDNQFTDTYNNFSDRTSDLLNEYKVGKKLMVKEIGNEVDKVMPEIMNNTTIVNQLKQMDREDNYTYKHSVNVCMLSMMLGKWLGIKENQLKELGVAAFLHDVGKLDVPEEILNKPGRLDGREMMLMRKHTVYAHDALSKNLHVNNRILKGIAHHHEKIDGSGYPYGLKGNKINLYSRIISVVDIFDAMTSERVYKDKVSPFKVAEILHNESYSTLDPKVTLTFLTNLSQFYMRNIVKLSNGEQGEIVYVPRTDPTRPIVRIGGRFVDLVKEKSLHVAEVVEG